MPAKKILVACGTATATSSIVAKKVGEELEKRGIEAEIRQCKASEVPSKASGQDLILATTFVSGTGAVPVIQAISFLTGVGVERDLEKILGILKA